MGLLGLLSGGYGAVQVMNDYPLTPVSLSSHAPYSKTSRWKVLIYYSYHISSTRCCSQIVAMASIHDAETRVPSDAHWAISRVACVLRLASMADSRTERLRVLLPASVRPSCDPLMYLINHCCYSPTFLWNESHPQIVAAASDQRNTVPIHWK